METPRIQVLAKDLIFSHVFYRGYMVRLRYTRFDGTMSEPIERFVLDRGDSVGVLLHDLPADEIVLVEQIRITAVAMESPLLLELPAGRIETGDEPAATARREVKEETGADAPDLEHISSFYLSPGGCTERLHLFYAPFPRGLVVEEHGGLAEENEDIRVHRVPFATAMEMIRDGRVADAKTIVGLLWLALRAPSAFEGRGPG